MAKPTPTSTPLPTPLPAVPLAHELRISKDASEWLKSLTPHYFQTNEDLDKAWSAPITQFSVTLLQDAQFKAAIEEIQGAHLGTRLLGYEFVLILFLWIFRAWRLGKASTLFTRVWTQAWIAVLFWIFAVFLVPGIVYGQAYLTVLKQLSQAILRHFFV